MNILTLYYICYVILAMYMLDTDQESSYNLSKNLLLLPRILKLIEDMVDDSTPLLIQYTYSSLNTGSLPQSKSPNSLRTNFAASFLASFFLCLMTGQVKVELPTITSNRQSDITAISLKIGCSKSLLLE